MENIEEEKKDMIPQLRPNNESQSQVEGLSNAMSDIDSSESSSALPRTKVFIKQKEVHQLSKVEDLVN